MSHFRIELGFDLEAPKIGIAAGLPPIDLPHLYPLQFGLENARAGASWYPLGRGLGGGTGGGFCEDDLLDFAIVDITRYHRHDYVPPAAGVEGAAFVLITRSMDGTPYSPFIETGTTDVGTWEVTSFDYDLLGGSNIFGDALPRYRVSSRLTFQGPGPAPKYFKMSFGFRLIDPVAGAKTYVHDPDMLVRPKGG